MDAASERLPSASPWGSTTYLEINATWKYSVVQETWNAQWNFHDLCTCVTSLSYI